MKNYFEGWKDIGEVMIPPVKQRGFRENVLRRRNIDPYNSMPEKQEDEKTLMLVPEEDSEETVMLSGKPEIWACLLRLKTGEVFEVTKSETRIGKSQEMDIVIRENPAISRQHARILFVQGEYYLEDFASKNHTYLNGKEVTEVTRLEDGAKIRFADEEFLFEIRQGNGR